MPHARLLFMIFHNSSMTIVDFRFPSITLNYIFEWVVEFNYFSAMTEMRQTQCRDSKTAPLTKLTIDLINTYKHINEVRLFITVDLNYDLFFLKVGTYFTRLVWPWFNLYMKCHYVYGGVIVGGHRVSRSLSFDIYRLSIIDSWFIHCIDKRPVIQTQGFKYVILRSHSTHFCGNQTV